MFILMVLGLRKIINHMPLAVITGGTKGIGRSLVMKFAQAGFDIATCARNETDLAELRKYFSVQFPKLSLLAMPCDVSIKKDIINFGEALLVMGTPEVVINNAGIFLPGNICDEAEGTFETLIQTNLASAYHLTRTLVPAMVINKSGYIFNLCSIASFMAYPGGGSYTISKFGLLGFSKSLREDLKQHNIRVSSVMPGATLTASWQGTNLPDERFINPDDLANLLFTFYNTPVSMVVEEIVIRPLKGDI
jgi:short-subunit dehydrogenase